MTSYQNTVCNTCKARKVKCDRNNPCGNCIDGNIQCLRTSSVVRQPRSASKRRREAESTTAQKSIRRHELQVSPSPSNPSPSMPQSPSILEAQDFIRQEINSGKHMPADRLAVLNAAMSFVNHLSRVTKPNDVSTAPSTRVLDVLEDISYPSVETLYWMLRELKGKRIGLHALDYFKHVSPRSLKDMGLALINRAGSPETLLLYSICVNSAAFKFINTVLSENSMEEVGAGMRTCATKYLSSVKLAMARIHLLSAPSLLFLQSLLCSAFIAQGSGDSTHCWTFITAACKVCEDLSLEAQVKACQTETEDDEEVYYCYIWCHILDKNYSMMQGRSRFLLEYDGLGAALSSPLNKSMSSLLSTYLNFVPVQAIYISELHPDKIVNNKSLLSRVEYVVQDLLERLERVHAKITELHGSPEQWGGLHIGSELNTIQFSYHSLRTSILRSRQICLPAMAYIDNDCLESARMAMTTLRAIQEESTAIIDVRAHVSYMHWTLLYHPLTPFFVLFCNVVASSNEQDFQLLKVVALQLDGLADLSPSIAKLQTLFKSFIDLCEGLVWEAKKSTSPVSRTDERPRGIERMQDLVFAPQPTNEQPKFAVSLAGLPPQLVPLSRPPQEGTIDFPNESGPGIIDPGWGLFDTQPTLDWLDADFSYFDNNQ
ncbi:uncharacterized protein K460DRAFT_413505 [Cucurbitaria berberidis CBS 394.84]|uniref:Zn(2)-C6 fungal-type domain-containing protein n=1 Tax=Cucurbitaria berberidis CBS 394.84 TaxID=1168544 RepID=A0A9P4GVF2_9PLEO|nr:uncharacterized protein K460DRAFT_413505 [Cucurbitaria berberidis CBS 394.84]KAF1852027.1 hypothetical protein K460DRAFT_413505 [Cucurbitaria berberidis CBS 394.84]